MEYGSIIYFGTLVFKDGAFDRKEHRPCIYLFEENENGVDYIYSVPITSEVSKFNQASYNYLFISETIYNYKKLSFAKINGIVKNKKEKAISCDFSLSTNTLNQLTNKIINNCHDKKVVNKIKEITRSSIQEEKGLSLKKTLN